MPDTLRMALNQFALGATRASLPALLGSVSVAALLFLLCLLELTPNTMATPAARIIVRKSRDHYGNVTLEALRLRRSPPQGLSVVLIGDSRVYEAIPRDHSLQDALSARLNTRVTVHILAAGALTQWEAVPIADSFGERVRGVVVLEISPFNVAMGGAAQHERIASPRVPLDSPALREEAHRAGETPPPQVGNYFLDHYSFFAGRVNLLLPMPDWYSQTRRGLKEWTPSQWKRARAKINGWVRSYSRERSHNLDMYARMIHRLQVNPGVVVALLEGAENPRNRDLAGKSTGARTDPYARYRQDMLQFAQRNDVAYWDISADAQLTESDFADFAHISNPLARARYTKVLTDRLAALISDKQLVQGVRP